ncbi:CBN-NAS-28 protein [Caenorhabditis brenneri]|uniref:Zinc metalloproteinase n=1 Tax=Caenorhabditis brenneri TaxID=135651 RepID=G0N2P6_CAEBE|nr:CBN-NAS-28 protein [Caenorhabditis brenneri]
MLLFPLICLPLLLHGAPANPKALNKILVDKNPDTQANREKIRGIIKNAFENRVPRVQGRQGVVPPVKLAALNYGPKNNQTKRFEELNSEIHEYTFESDIMLNEKQAMNLANSIENGNYRAKRQAIVDSTLFWNASVPIYYQFDTKLSATNIANVRKAIKFWNDNSCLNFQESSSANNRLFMSSAGGCWSYVGKQENMPYQMVSVGPMCDTLGTATHELMHAIGFWHQQSRSDRDDYVYVDFSNIIPSQAYNFQKMPLDQAQLLNLPYDYGSVMQYYPYAFALDSKQYTILAKQDGYQNSMGQREAPAFSDLIGVNRLYNCSNQCKTQMTCSNCGFTDSRNCNQCKCPNYFTGPTCDALPTGTALNCNGQILQATSTWQSFNATAGDPNSYTSSTDNSTNCFWHIKALAGQKVEFKLVRAPMAAICMQECPWQSIEINLGRFDLFGMITCCDTFLNQVLTSVQNTVALRGIVRYNQLNFGIQYRAVPTQGTVVPFTCGSK